MGRICRGSEDLISLIKHIPISKMRLENRWPSRTSYWSQIDNPQVAFAVKQQNPDNLDSAVSTTLEMESYLASKSTTVSSTVAVVESEATPTTDEGAETVGAVNTATGLMKELLERMEKLETEVSAAKERTGPKPRGLQQRRQGGNGRRSDITCWSCGGPGHFARDCHAEDGKRPTLGVRSRAHRGETDMAQSNNVISARTDCRNPSNVHSRYRSCRDALAQGRLGCSPTTSPAI